MAGGWIDVHGHFNVIALRPPGYDASKAWTFAPETSLDFMDRTGVVAQLLSNYGPQTTATMIAANNHGAGLVAKYPGRFGLLAQLPLAEPENALAELRRCVDQLDCEGFAIQSNYSGVYLGDPRFEPLWAEFDSRRATVFLHPTPLGYEDTCLGRPGALIEAPFDTARTVVDMLYAGVFRRYQNFNLILAHGGGVLPTLAGRLETLGPWPLGWADNPQHVTTAEMRETFARLYYDTALAGTAHSLDPVLDVTTPDHILYGADFGAPCTYTDVCRTHYDAVRNNQRMTPAEREAIGRNALRLFPKFAKRIAEAAARVAAE
jgi:predicted TIM-barrel fold metal-dependent hydrolase